MSATRLGYCCFACSLAIGSLGLAQQVTESSTSVEVKTVIATPAEPSPSETPSVKPAAENPREEKPRIELAILLDTSGSMTGLINQARAHLWQIVNEFESVRRGGQRPDVYVALYEYGNSNLSGESGYIRQIVPLTLDLDKISEELFALTTTGGSEHCGQVIDRAVRDLAWSKEGGNLRSIFIAGNEPFTQGPVDFREACSLSAGNGITVSTIHCGDHETGVRTMWAEGAKLADGSYLSINQNQVARHIDAPQDTELQSLSAELNQTYVAYGSATEREAAGNRQQAQDANAAKLSASVAAGRTLTKASSNYRNSHWDLVDALTEKKLELKDIPAEQLPEALRKMTLAERTAYIQEKSEQRTAVKAKIKTLTARRNEFLTQARKELAEEQTDDTLDSAITKAVREQAEKKQFKFGATE